MKFKTGTIYPRINTISDEEKETSNNITKMDTEIKNGLKNSKNMD